MEQNTEASQAVDEREQFVQAYLQAYPGGTAYDAEIAYGGYAGTMWLAAKRSLRAALKAQPAPTEAAQGALSANPNLTTSGVTCQPVAAQGNTSNNSSSSQLSGNSGELQPSGSTGELAQGEDSARLDFVEAHPEMTLYRHKKKWSFRGFTNYEFEIFSTVREAIDRARASAETGGVKP